VNGTAVVSTQDPFNRSVTRFGLAANDGSGPSSRFDDVSFTLEGSDPDPDPDPDPAPDPDPEPDPDPAPDPDPEPDPGPEPGPNPADFVVDFVDTFSRSDSAVLGKSETGQGWEHVSGSWAIDGGRAVQVSSSYVMAFASIGSGVGVYEATVSAASSEFWLLLRMTDGLNYWRFGWAGEGPYVLQQVKDSSLGSFAKTTLATVMPEDGDRMSCDLAAASITCSVNGTPVVSTGDGFSRTASTHGFAAGPHTGTPARVDDLLFGRPRATPSVVETFSRSDLTGLGQADSGQPWVIHSGGWSVEDGCAVPTGSGLALATLDPGHGYGYLEVTVDKVAPSFWIVLRYVDPLNYWSFGRFANGNYVLQRIENGQVDNNMYGFSFNTVTPADGDQIRIRLLANDGIDAYVNDVLVSGTGHLFQIGVPTFGLRTLRPDTTTPAARFSNVRFTPFFDD
jgi:hypothetical protein